MIKVQRSHPFSGFLGFSLLFFGGSADSLELSCSTNQIEGKVPSVTFICDYQHNASFLPERLSLKINNEDVTLSKENVKKFPGSGEKIGVLAMFDISDPARSATVENFYPRIEKILNRDNDNLLFESIGFAAGLSEETAGKSVKEMHANGAATELFRSTIMGLDRLSELPADRRILVVVSDGKAEDTAYKIEDVISAAAKSKVRILTLGVSERSQDAPFLQVLRKIADLSEGKFIDLSSRKVPASLQESMLNLLDPGGRVTFEALNIYGETVVSISLESDSGEVRETRTTVSLPDPRAIHEKILGGLKKYWIEALIGISALSIFIFILMRFRRRKKNLIMAASRAKAHLRQLDDTETEFELHNEALTIGRNAANSICLNNTSVSSRHAEIQPTRDGGFRLIDLASTNGVLVNGEPQSTSELLDGDIIEIGEVRFQFFENEM